MASKRTATSELTDRNWDDDTPPEDSGTFAKASEEALKKRVIKTARRRNPISSTSESNTKSAFGSFVGFNKSSSGPTQFAFLGGMTVPKDDTSAINGVTSNPSIFTQPSNISNMVNKPLETKPLHSNNEDEYYAKLKGLNESVSNWIKKHVDTNPLINLRPVFKDYEKYFEELERTRSLTSSEVTKADDSTSYKKELNTFVFKSATDSKEDTSKKPAQFKFSVKENSTDKTTTTTPPMFNFSSGATTSAATFSFGSNATSSNTSFNFGSTSEKPFSFANVTKPPANKEETSEDQEDEPPKVEFVPVVEEGHTYSVKCKVFVKNQNTYGDRGVGTLYLKPVPSSVKTQLIVRADTSLGNLLCNFILSKEIPTKRMGKKDVMLVCLPTPESKPPPVPILLRVKSPEQADELLAALDKHKK